MQTDHFKRHVVGPSHNEPAVVAPGDANNALTMQVPVLFIEHKGGEGLSVRGSLKNLGFKTASHEEELGIGGERHGCDLTSEVEMSHHTFALHVDDQGEAVFVDGDQGLAVRGETELRYVGPILEGQRLRNVSRQVKQVDFVSNRGQEHLV